MTPRKSIRRMQLARIVWVVTVTLAVGMFFAGVPLRFAELQAPCTDTPANCSNHMVATAAELGQLGQGGITPQQYALILTGVAVVSTLAYLAIGLLIFVRQSDDLGALVVSLALVLFGTSSAMWQALANQYPVFGPLAEILFFMGLAAFGLLFAVFPNGKVVPRAMWLVIAIWTMYAFVDAFAGDYASRALDTSTLANIAWTVMFLGGIGAQIYRYFRVSTLTEREQTKWVVFGFSVLVVFVLCAFSLFAPDQSYFQGVSIHRLGFQIFSLAVAFLTVPVPITISILRYRLFDIDVIIRRTLTYAIVAALLVIIYFGSVILLQRVFALITGQQSEVITVLSTLAIAALFIPLRNRIQNVIDKRFNRKKYDAQQVLTDFGKTVRDETDLDKLTGRLIEVVNETMQPKDMSLWIKK